MKEKTVLIITDTLCDANGVSRFIQDLACYAIKERKPLKVVTSTKKRYCRWQSNMFNLKPLLALPMPFYPELDLVFVNPFKLYSFIKKTNPDVIHISTPGTIGFWGMLFAKWKKIPLYGTYHTDFPSYLYANTKSKLVKNITTWFMRRFYKGFKALFVRSYEYFEIVRDELKFKEDRIYPIPPGIDLYRFNPDLRDKNLWHKVYNLPQNAVIALYVGRLSVEKSVPFLLELWKDIVKNYPNAWLVMIGSGKYYKRKDEYKKHNILFLGHKEGVELSTLYASSDFFVFPSVTDTLGQVVMEALASGLPVLVSDIGGPKTLVDNENGYVLKANNKEEWQRAIEDLISHPQKIKELSNGAKKSAKKFSFARSFEFFWKKHQE